MSRSRSGRHGNDIVSTSDGLLPSICSSSIRHRPPGPPRRCGLVCDVGHQACPEPHLDPRVAQLDLVLLRSLSWKNAVLFRSKYYPSRTQNLPTTAREARCVGFPFRRSASPASAPFLHSLSPRLIVGRTPMISARRPTRVIYLAQGFSSTSLNFHHPLHLGG